MTQKIVTQAQRNNVSVNPLVKQRVSWATDFNDDTPEEFIFKVATVEHLLSDLQAQANYGDLATKKHSPNLLAKMLSKYCDYLAPTETEISLIIDAACYICDVTLGTEYLSHAVRQQRIDQFWQTLDSLSPENFSNISTEQIIDNVAYIAARATYALGTRAAVSVLSNMQKVVATFARGAAIFAQRFVQVLDFEAGEIVNACVENLAVNKGCIADLGCTNPLMIRSGLAALRLEMQKRIGRPEVGQESELPGFVKKQRVPTDKEILLKKDSSYEKTKINKVKGATVCKKGNKLVSKDEVRRIILNRERDVLPSDLKKLGFRGERCTKLNYADKKNGNIDLFTEIKGGLEKAKQTLAAIKNEFEGRSQLIQKVHDEIKQRAFFKFSDGSKVQLRIEGKSGHPKVDVTDILKNIEEKITFT